MSSHSHFSIRSVFAAAVVMGFLAFSPGSPVAQAQDLPLQDSLTAARLFQVEVDRFLEQLPLDRERLEVRVSRCDSSRGEQRDDIYYIWIGMRGAAHNQASRQVFKDLHAGWQEAGWEIIRFRQLDNGGVNLAAIEPSTGNSYMLDSGFTKGPKTYVVGMFSTFCQQDPSGAAPLGDVSASLSQTRLSPPNL